MPLNKEILWLILTVASALLFSIDADELSDKQYVNGQCQELNFILDSAVKKTSLPSSNEIETAECLAKVSTQSESTYCEEVTKFNILQKLGLPKVPENVNTDDIPNNHNVFKKLRELYPNLNPDQPDIDSVILFSTPVTKSGKYYRLKFKLSEIPKNIKKEDVTSARIYFYHNGSRETTYSTRLPQQDLQFIKDPPIYVTTTSGRSRDWMSIDIENIFSIWDIRFPVQDTVLIKCQDCANDENTISTDINERPYLRLMVKGSSVGTIRSCIHSIDEVKCSKRSTDINFADIGWDRWIIYQTSYTAYYCKGFCYKGWEKEITCVPTETIPLLLIYWQGDALIANIIPDMTVKKCSCMNKVN